MVHYSNNGTMVRFVECPLEFLRFQNRCQFALMNNYKCMFLIRRTCQHIISLILENAMTTFFILMIDVRRSCYKQIKCTTNEDVIIHQHQATLNMTLQYI